MEELYNLGISEATIISMMELNPYLKDISSKEIQDKINILTEIGCSQNQIINILGSNSLCLSRTNNEILNLINFLNNKKFTVLNILFDSNPYILNFEPFEIQNYINKRLENGEQEEDIIDDLESNTYLFNEV